MALTKDQSDQLKDYFPAQAHEFLQGNTYLSEEAITNRLDDVDPSWEFHRLGDFAYRDNSIIATFRLTVSGVSRDGIGMWDLTIKKKDGNLMPAVDPEKSVSTDALKRAARLFGIGRYILEMKGVNDYRTLEDWLAKRRGIDKQTGELRIVRNGDNSRQEGATGVSSPTPAQSTTQPQPTAESAKTALGTPNGQRMGGFTYERTKMFLEVGKVATEVSTPERNNTVIAMEGEGAFKSITSYQQGVDLVIARLNSPEHGKSKKAQPA